MSTALALIHTETGNRIKSGEMLVHPETRTAWRFEGIVIPISRSKHSGQHMIRVSAYVRKMRIIRIFHPHMFRCLIQEVHDSVTSAGARIYLSVRKWWHSVRDQVIVPVWLGVIAWFVLALADHFHWAELMFGSTGKG